MLREVERLRSEGEFSVVTEAVPIVEVEEMPIQSTIVGQEKMLETVWNRLMDDKVGVVGLYGMGGVGKTTLLKQINNKFSEISGRFDVVIWVVVSKNATVHRIQGDIGAKLGLSGKEWDEKDDRQRALDIHNILKKKKFVLLLDDIWEKVNLNVVGVPYPNRENGCKVAFTTRSRDVCGRMEVEDPIEVRCLDPNKAWDLFKKKVGNSTLGSHPDIPKLARKVAEKCRGLPLALNVIGEAMTCKTTIQEWHHAFDVLTSSASEFSGMVEEIIPILKYSYENESLNGEQVKSCFLYCSLFPEDYSLGKERLIEHWIGAGLIDENEGYGIIGTLVRACLLLEEGDDKLEVKMHDVVRDMALWITTDLGKNKEKCIVHSGVGIREIPKVENWKKVRRMSLMENKIGMISESHECPELTTLLLGGNRSLATISGEFFRCMPRLLVLDLSKNYSLRGLPEEISGLVSLRYLDLSMTKIERLPVGLQELKMLIHLNLEDTAKLKSLQGISNLASLRTLKLLLSRVWLNMSLMKELQLLQHLEFITAIISSKLVGDELLYDSRVGRCIQNMYISEPLKNSVKVLVLPTIDKLREVAIEECKMEEIKIVKTTWNKSMKTPCFLNLSNVDIFDCHGLKDLTWLLFAPKLSSLRVLKSKTIEEIISKEKAASVLEKGTCTILPFQKLEYLELEDLPELKSIYWNALPIQRLRKLFLTKCPKLRKLPLDSKSVSNIQECNIYYKGEEWIKRVEWEDEATHHRFLPRLIKMDKPYFDKFETDSFELSSSSSGSK